jgi:hypothetical protein
LPHHLPPHLLCYLHHHLHVSPYQLHHPDHPYRSDASPRLNGNFAVLKVSVLTVMNVSFRATAAKTHNFYYLSLMEETPLKT